MGFLFVLVPLFIGAVFIFVFGTIIATAIKGFSEWSSNNAKPKETISARVVTKRQHVSGGSGDSSASTWYHATFETIATGDRQEFEVGSAIYSGIVEGDTGQLTYQGTRFVDFQRERNITPPQPAPIPPPGRCTYCEGPIPADALKCPSCGAVPK